MSLLFPSLVGQGWSVHKKPKFDVRVAPHASGREARVGKYATPMWEFELTFDALDMTATGAYGALGAQSMQTLAGFFLQCQGKANPFVYVDPTDNTVVNATVGVGDGVTTFFTLMRPMGAYSEPVGALVSVNAVRLNGANNFNWAAAQPNTVTFGVPPAAGVVITADFKFGYACRFTEDVEDFEEFMAMLSGVKTLAFQSVRDIVPFEITALRTIVIQFPIGAGEFCAPPDWNNNFNRVIAIGGGGSGGYTPGTGGGGGACTYRDNVQLDVGECVPILIGDGGPGGEAGGDWGLAGYPTTFHNPGDPDYIYADYGGSNFPPGEGGLFSSQGGQAGKCIPSNVAHSGGSGMTVHSFAAGGNGGGGAGGPFGDGADGGSAAVHDTQSGAGGGGADGGAIAADPIAATYNIGLIVPGFAPATAGGAARDGTPGGAAGAIDTNPATGANGPGAAGLNGSGGGGGGGGLGGVNGSDGNAMYGFGDGGAGSTEPLWFSDGVWYGPGAGGGGAGGVLSFFDGGFAGAGGPGGKFGGGGGGGGGKGSGVDGDGGKTSGAGGIGGLIIIYLRVETSG